MPLRLAELTGAQLPSIRLPLLPGALTADQVDVLAHAIATQRIQLKAFSEQISTLDEQLAVLERLLAPLVKGSAMVAAVEKGVVEVLPLQAPAEQ